MTKDTASENDESQIKEREFPFDRTYEWYLNHVINRRISVFLKLIAVIQVIQIIQKTKVILLL